MGNRQQVEIKMEQITTLSLSEVREATDTAQANSEVLIEGQSTGMIVPGKVLEGAIRVDSHRFLLFVTDDVIFEEALTILLIDHSQRVVMERLVIGAAYTSGLFEGLKVSADGVSFRFMGDTTWTVKIVESPMLRLPFSEPHGVSRSPGLRKYLTISAIPPLE